VATAPAAALTAPPAPPGALATASILALGLLGTAAAFVLFYTLITEAGPARAALVTYLAPGFSVVYGVVLLDERFTLGTLLGLALILGGSWLAGARPRSAAAVVAAAEYAPAPRQAGDLGQRGLEVGQDGALRARGHHRLGQALDVHVGPPPVAAVLDRDQRVDPVGAYVLAVAQRDHPVAGLGHRVQATGARAAS
jgi:hypothetical protein